MSRTPDSERRRAVPAILEEALNFCAVVRNPLADLTFDETALVVANGKALDALVAP